MKEKCQIIGKVTGLDRATCVEKFQKTQDKLEAMGYEVINPVTLVPETDTWQEAMRTCILHLLTADAVAVQPDWYDSQGARTEYMLASTLRIKMIRI